MNWLNKTFPSLFKLSTKTVLIFCFGFFALVYIRNCSAEKEAIKAEGIRAAQEKVQKEKEAALLKLAPKERAQEVLGKMLLESFKGVREKNKDINVSWTPINDEFIAEVTIVIQTKISNGHPDNETFIEAAMEFAKAYIQNEHLKIVPHIKIITLFIGLDKYARETLARSAKVELQRDELLKINWSNMNTRLFFIYLNHDKK